MQIKDYIIIILTALCIFFFIKLCRKDDIDSVKTRETYDYTIKYDTVSFIQPDYISKITIDSVPFYFNDSCISIPIEQLYYSDSLYSAWVSGYNVSIDSLKIIEKITEITHTIERDINHYQKFGILAGVGVGSNFKGKIELSPYIGAEINKHNVLIGYDVLNKDLKIMYAYKFTIK